MKILNCENFDSTLKSVSNILNIDESKLLGLLERDYDIEYQDYNLGMFDEFLYEKIVIGRKDITIDKVCWFHLTRTTTINSFYEKGILPLGQVIEYIHQALYELVQDEISINEWEELLRKKDGHFAYLYAKKLSEKIHHGCYAMLVKDVAFCSDGIGNHDYLNVPEIVEDIISSIPLHSIDLLKLFIKNTKPVIVKFISDIDREVRYLLPSALCYMYCKIRNEALWDGCNTCFNAMGRIIVPKDILSIEVVENY